MGLLIAMPGLAPDLLESAGGSPVLPQLPALSAMLQAARRLPDASDWRSGVFQALQGSPVTDAPPAASVAAPLVPSLGADAPLCIVSPLHVVAGISRVHLPPGGCLHLEQEEAARFEEQFNRDLGGPDLQLRSAWDGWLLSAPFAAAARDAPPEELIGQPLERAAARDAAERELRRLGAEAEIWLAGHALNDQRERQRQPPINSLWFWGGARTAPLPKLARAPAMVVAAAAPDAWLGGLARHCAASVAQADAWSSDLADKDALVVLPPAHHGDTASHWRELETRWFEPVWKALGTRDLRDARLQIGGTAWQLRHFAPLAWLRPRRSWFQRVAS
jgi:hypothetical protein